MVGIWSRLFGRKARDALMPLYLSIVDEARRPAWYREGRVPDTLDGRFDMVAAILSLVLLRLEEEGEPGRAPSAHLTEIFIDDMDGQLRERGIGDMIVGKHIGQMMGALGGRLGALREAFAGGDLDGAIIRNLYRGELPAPESVAMVRDGLTSLRARLSVLPAASLLGGQWPA
jgi:cytochrome b pre-mRNA-processing protein 3